VSISSQKTISISSLSEQKPPNAHKQKQNAVDVCR